MPEEFVTTADVNNISADNKAWIDSASYKELLERWRFGETGESSMFRGDTGIYYYERMKFLINADPGGAVAASREIGWEKKKA